MYLRPEGLSFGFAAAREHDAYAARDALIDALEAMEVAERAYAEIERSYVEFLRAVPGVDGRDVPSLDLSAPKNEIQRVRSAASSHRCLGPSTAARTPTR